ncbi:MAG: 5,10-methylene tetrahydromethanopterin reductase [Acidimicrobiales bacterium]|nr:5,10-methylene tetrahydromethanopterin reductase [Acidimicrobiales bacterium]
MLPRTTVDHPPPEVPSAPGFREMFAPGRLSLGLFFAIESYHGDVPTMEGQIELAQAAERHGFAALWVRDVPLRDLTFGDVGQIYDPWVWLGYVVAHTQRIGLATGAVVFPLRHPLDLAKAAASVDNLSGGRLVLGAASGDRPVEFPAFGRDFRQRGELFTESLRVFREALEQNFPTISSPFGRMQNVDLIPKPLFGHIPIAVTGYSQQSIEWIAANADAWISYPRDPQDQAQIVRSWRTAVRQCHAGIFKPFGQSLYIDLTDDPRLTPRRIHLGYRLGRVALIDILGHLQEAGVNHVVLNLKYAQRPASDIVDELGREVVPHFAAHSVAA